MVPDGRGQQPVATSSCLEMAGPARCTDAPVRSGPEVPRLDALRPQVSMGRLRGIEDGPEFCRTQTGAPKADQVLHLDGLRGRGRDLAQVVRVLHGERAAARFAGTVGIKRNWHD